MVLRPDDTTLRTLKDALSTEYVRLVLKQIRDCENQLGDAQVRVCRDPNVNPPHYRIDAVMDLDTGETTGWESFSGKTHKPLTARQQSDVLWASAHMTFRQVSKLIGDMRNYTKRTRAP
jgi:hypothetical protein